MATIPTPRGSLTRSVLDVLQLRGEYVVIGSESVLVYLRDEDGDVLWASGLTVPTNSTSGYATGAFFADTDSDKAYVNRGSSTSCTFQEINTGGGGVSGSLEDAYDNGSTVEVDSLAVIWNDARTGAENTMEFVKDGAGSGNIIDISVDAALTGTAIALDMNLGIAAPAITIDNGATARTAADIQVTDDSTGTHSVIDINSSGSGASTGFDWTGSYNGSPGGNAISVTMDNADNLDTGTILVTRGTGIRTAPVLNIDDASTGSAHLIDVDLTGIFTGNVFDFASSAAATGNVINMNLDNAVAMTGLHIEGSGVRTQPMVEIITDSTSSASLIDISVDGAITGTAAVDIDMNAGLAANAIYIDAGAGTRTADEIAVKHDGDGNIDVMSIVATNTGSGAIFDINMDAAGSTSGVFNIDMNAAVGAPVMVIDGGAGTRTVSMIDVTFDGDGNVEFIDLNCTNTGSGHLFDIDVTGIHTGNAIDITYGTAASTGDAIHVAMGTNLAGGALVITGTGTRTDDLVEIDTDQDGAANIVDIATTGALSGNAVNINYGATGTGVPLAITSAADSYALDIIGDKASASQAVARITATNTGGTNACLELDQDDTDVGFLVFTGTAASGGSINTDDKSGGVAVYITIDINGTPYWIKATPGA